MVVISPCNQFCVRACANMFCFIVVVVIRRGGGVKADSGGIAFLIHRDLAAAASLHVLSDGRIAAMEIQAGPFSLSCMGVHSCCFDAAQMHKILPFVRRRSAIAKLSPQHNAFTMLGDMSKLRTHSLPYVFKCVRCASCVRRF